GVDVTASPEKAQAGEEANERSKIARLLHKGAHAPFVSFINLMPGHGAGIHHYGNMLEDRMLLEMPQNAQPIEHRHEMIENDDARFAARTVAKLSLPIETIEHFLSVAGNDKFVFQISRFEGALYKQDVVRI